MASLFVDLEAQVAQFSSDETDDDDQGDFIDDEHTPNDAPGTSSSMQYTTSSSGSVAVPFLEDLEQRYTRTSVSDRAPSSSRLGSDPGSDSTVLGKRKAIDLLESWHPVLPIAARHPSPPPAPASSSSSAYHGAVVPIHPLTKQRLPVREQPIRVPEDRRVLESDPNTVEMFGLWRNGPPSSAIRKPQPALATTESQIRFRTEFALGEWVSTRRGTYKGDLGQIWKIHNRQKTSEELRSEQQQVEEALKQGSSPPDPLPEFVFEGYWVLVVPRFPPLHFTHQSSLKLKPQFAKGRKRFPPVIFNPRKYDIIIPEKNVKSAQGFDIDGRLVSHGLLIKLFKTAALDPAFTVPSQTIRAFQDHPHSKRFLFPIPGQWCFLDGEEVDVERLANWESGRGVVKVSMDGSIAVDYGAPGLHPAPIHLVCKVIGVGDYIRVLSGDQSGKEGLVVEKRVNILAVSEKGSRQGIDFFVHVNSATQEKGKFDCSSIPWLDQEVSIVKGPAYGNDGIIKDVIRKPNRTTLFLWLYLPHLKRTLEIADTHVVAKGTREPLWKLLPLREDQKHYNIDRSGSTTSGQVPWTGLYVGVIKGPHKGKEGTVQDVNRTQHPFAISGLMVTIEFNLMGSPCEHIYYDYVRERHTGLTLAGYHPLRSKEAFFRPNPKFEHNAVDKSRLLDPGDESLVIPDVDPNGPMDVWNPYWEYPGSLRVQPPSPSLSPSTQPVQPRPTQSNYEAAARHVLARSELVGVSVLVDIQNGPHKRAGVYVKLSRTPTGAIIGVLRKGKGNHTHEILLTSIAVSDRRVDQTKDDPLLVVIAGEHLGKLVRRVCHFYVGPETTGETKWLVLAVVDKDEPVNKLTGDLVECALGELAFVEEAPTDRFRATHVTMKQVHDEARLKMSAEVRQPGEGDLDCLRAMILGQFSAGHST
ncbi:hypothetical protein V5O48_006324 [Marasmius crinis-equi]|uniref:KOW domain-containing protein n=1 Tax=Marasmius crinis-equi TaxID=585013 RepID=A0ABR3FJS0_9AGAR